MPDYESRLRMLEEENSGLRDRVTELEVEIGLAHEPFPVYLDLTGSESICLGVLMKNSFPRNSTFMTALYSDKNQEERDEKIIDIFIHKLRKKLKAHGIEIETVWGQGYKMAEAQKVAVRQLMEAA